MTDVSMVMTFHGEGRQAHRSLRAMARCLAHAAGSGLSVEAVLVLDAATAETRSCVAASGLPGRVVETALGDAGEARNAGIAAASGALVGICDGDDYLSENWVSAATAASRSRPDAVMVPEYVVNFGAEEGFVRQVDSEAEPLPLSALMAYNPWSTAWAMAPAATFRAHPYVATRAAETGFGFEDWHWRCEVTAAGHPHLTVPGTAGFYRRSAAGRLASEETHRSVLRPTRLFEIPRRHLSVTP